jgi:putative transposase
MVVCQRTAFYLRQPTIADMIVQAIQYNASILGRYLLHAFVVMPNQVHLLATLTVPLPKLTKSLKGMAAKPANAMLATTGRPFWQEESYDHLVRLGREFDKIRQYIEGNPVRAGLVKEWRPGGRLRTKGSAPQPAINSCECGDRD